MLKLLKTIGFVRILASRAAAARMWPAWYYLTRIVALASARMSLEEFSASAKVAREGPFDRNVGKQWVFLKVSASARGQMFQTCADEKVLFSYVLLNSDVEIVENICFF